MYSFIRLASQGSFVRHVALERQSQMHQLKKLLDVQSYTIKFASQVSGVGVIAVQHTRSSPPVELHPAAPATVYMLVISSKHCTSPSVGGDTPNEQWTMGISGFPLSAPRQLPQFVLHTEFVPRFNVVFTQLLVSGQHFEGLPFPPINPKASSQRSCLF